MKLTVRSALRLILILSGFSLMLACKSKLVENPAADAPTYQASEFKQDIQFINYGHQLIENSSKIKTIQNADARKKWQEKIDLRLSVLQELLKKYSGPFRLRAANGDLSLKELSPDVVSQILVEISLLRSLSQDLQKASQGSGAVTVSEVREDSHEAPTNIEGTRATEVELLIDSDDSEIPIGPDEGY